MHMYAINGMVLSDLHSLRIVSYIYLVCTENDHWMKNAISPSVQSCSSFLDCRSLYTIKEISAFVTTIDHKCILRNFMKKQMSHGSQLTSPYS